MCVQAKKLLVTVIVAGWMVWGGAALYVEASDLNQDFRLWAPVYLNVPIAGPVLGYMEVSPRLSDDVSHIDQLLLRPAVGYQLTPTISLWQGYAWVANYEPNYTQEHWMYQQLTYNKKFSTFQFISRTRLEERWIQHANGTSLRARTMLRVNLPLPAYPALALVAFDEIFANLNTIRQGPEAGFDQNRLFLGLNYTFSSSINVDAGYQMQLINTALSGLANQANNMILLQLFINL